MSDYYGRPELRDWTVAGLSFWAKIQHRDGSFDEFYPFERGWVGPTAFTTYAACEAYALLKDEIEEETGARIEGAILRAAKFIARGESERDLLANHHAMAALAVWKAHRLSGDPKLLSGFEKIWTGFRRLHNEREGWSLEYDGADPGYQSATVSFLAKIWDDVRRGELLEALRQSVTFCSYFAYPDGHYGGVLGSRNTLHFYPHGFELLASKIPLAGAVADRMLNALAEGKLVPPHIMSDRYVFYSVPELLLAYLAHGDRETSGGILPDEKEGLEEWLPSAGIRISTRGNVYSVCNLAKGGVVKLFDRRSGRMVLSDGGVLAQSADGSLLSSQWIDPDRHWEMTDEGWTVEGPLYLVPSNRTFTPLLGVVFRIVLILVGWLPWAAHRLKGLIRGRLMLGARPSPVRLRRSFELGLEGASIVDRITRGDDGPVVRKLRSGGDFNVRYVPQSRFFQPYELRSHEFEAVVDVEPDFEELKVVKSICLTGEGSVVVSISAEPSES